MTQQRKMGKLPQTAVKWVKYVLGFSVSVAVGLAPYLGRVNVPLFTPMLSFIPLSLQDTAIPLSSAAMGIVAVVVQWYDSQQVSKGWASKVFGKTVAACVLSLLAIVVVETFGVERVYVPSIKETASFVVGFSYPHTPPCQGLGRAKCITERLVLDQDTITTYFGEGQVKSAQFLLVLTYTVFMATFGVMIGL